MLKSDGPIWVEQWPLVEVKPKALKPVVQEQLSKGHTVPPTSPWNIPVFVIHKQAKTSGDSYKTTGR